MNTRQLLHDKQAAMLAHRMSLGPMLMHKAMHTKRIANMPWRTPEDEHGHSVEAQGDAHQAHCHHAMAHPTR